MEDDKVETLFPLPFWAVVLIAAFCWPAMAGAQAALHVHEEEALTIKLMPTPCVDPVSLDLAMRNSPPSMHSKWRHIDSNWKMRDGSRRDFAGCWLEVGESFLMVFEDRTGGAVSKAEFGKRRGVTGV